LRQLLRSSDRVTALPQPVRIADDWEERNIVQEDLKAALQLRRIDDIQDLLHQLSADWQTLTADNADWEKRFPDPRFLAAWREHRRVYGYSLRSELVYQLKRALEQDSDFPIEGPPSYLLVDEYQDLNRCDLAVVAAVAARGAELYAAGDDDQSIYGFRKAQPEGIRRFGQDFAGATELELQVCKRCDPEILELALFVARQDTQRLEKPLRPDQGRSGGRVAILQFSNQAEEAATVATVCENLTRLAGLEPHEILILLRSDRNGVFSSVLREAFEASGQPVPAATNSEGPFDNNSARVVLALLRLADNVNDSLAWRTLLQLASNGLGSEVVSAVYQLAVQEGIPFSSALRRAANQSGTVAQRFANRLKLFTDKVSSALALAPREGGTPGAPAVDTVAWLQSVVPAFALAGKDTTAALDRIDVFKVNLGLTFPREFLQAFGEADADIEQELEVGRVNILTMHRAKGLTAKAVIVVGAEDEYIPGRQIGDAEGDERRLLYVSLTRAAHYLFVTYCTQRTGRQMHSGRTSGRSWRTLTRFLRDGPLAPTTGRVFLERIGEWIP
jgi:DNA helicase-2/ATP-dependent DNA helicase PcrA